MQFPEQISAIFQIYIKLYITRLIDKVYFSITTDVFSRTELPHAPTTYRISASSEVTLLIRNYRSISVRKRKTETYMKSQGIAVVDNKILYKVEIELCILRKCYIEQFVMAVFVLTTVKQFGNKVQKIAGRLNTKTNLIRITVVIHQSGAFASLRIENNIVSTAHYEEVLIRIPQNRIARGSVVKIIAPESFRNPRHENIVQA